MKQRYYSKVDAWLFIALAAPFIALVLFFIIPEAPFNDVWEAHYTHYYCCFLLLDNLPLPSMLL